MKRSSEKTSKTGYETFVLKAKKRSEHFNGSCTQAHRVGGTVTRKGVQLGCCGGSSTTCKFDDIDWLLNEIKHVYEENDRLRDMQKSKKSKVVIDTTPIQPVAMPVYQPPVANNYLTINNYMFGDSAVAKLAEYAPQMLQAAWANKDLMKMAVQVIQNSPPSQEKDELLMLQASSEPRDNLNFKRQVVEIMEEQVDRLPVEMQEATKAKLSAAHDEIDKLTIANGISLVDVD